METSRAVPLAPLRAASRELPIIGGHVALDFANTVDDPEGRARWDHVSTYSDLLGWARQVHALSDDLLDGLRDNAARHPRLARMAHGRALEARATLNAVFGAIANDEEPAGSAWAALREQAAQGLRRSELALTHSVYVPDWADPSDLDTVLWPIVDAAVQLLRSPDLGRVKRCAGCPWLFLDRSKNGSRRWCAMDDCGTHAKIQRYVARRATLRHP
jgi:predicted RNA-binding Zn ribbon-like protein